MTPLDMKPNSFDGPLMKWLLANGRKHVPNRDEWRTYKRDITGFRKARDGRWGHGTLRITMNIDEVKAELEFEEAECARYKTTLDFMPKDSSATVYLREIVGATRTLTVGTDAIVPTILADGLIGQPIDRVISLPGKIQPIIAGRVIKSIRLFDEWTTFTLDSKEWR